MKKLTVFFALALLLVLAGAVYAGGGPNGTYVHFTQGSYDCHTYWRMTGSGLVHEWRSDCAPYAGVQSLHLVFKPTSKFPSADCDDEGYLGSMSWTANLGAYVEHEGDDADLSDFLDDGRQYWVCFYSWDGPGT